MFPNLTNASGAIWWPNLELMQICNQGKWRHLVGRFGTNAVSATLWSKLEPIEWWIFLSTEFASFVAGEIIRQWNTLLNIKDIGQAHYGLPIWSHFPKISIHVKQLSSCRDICYTELYDHDCWSNRPQLSDYNGGSNNSLLFLCLF